MRTDFFCTNFLNTPRSPGHPGKIPGKSQIPLFETRGRQTFEGGQELFGHHPFAGKTSTPPGGLRTQKVNLCALFSCLKDDETSVPVKGTDSGPYLCNLLGPSKQFLPDGSSSARGNFMSHVMNMPNPLHSQPSLIYRA